MAGHFLTNGWSIFLGHKLGMLKWLIFCDFCTYCVHLWCTDTFANKFWMIKQIIYFFEIFHYIKIGQFLKTGQAIFWKPRKLAKTPESITFSKYIMISLLQGHFCITTSRNKWCWKLYLAVKCTFIRFTNSGSQGIWYNGVPTGIIPLMNTVFL